MRGHRKVLFIDDEQQILDGLSRYFSRHGYATYRAESGAEGIKTFDRVSPDVTVLDIYMPGMDGMEVLERLRRKGATVIMLTGYGGIDHAVEAMRLGAENFLTKPVDMGHLAAAVDKAAEKTALRQENVRLRALVAPSIRRRVFRAAIYAALATASAGMGAWIGGEPEDVRPRRPIPVPIDAADTVIPQRNAPPSYEVPQRTRADDTAPRGL